MALREQYSYEAAFLTPVGNAMAQLFAYEAIRRLIEQPQHIIGCLLAYRDPGTI